jgi:hypothetical protein
MAMIQMNLNSKIFLVLLFAVVSLFGTAQTDQFKPNPEKEKKFLPYLAAKHGGLSAIEEWKKSNTVLYYKELWYFSESFYVKRNHSAEGVSLDESIIDISRFESNRKPNEEAIVILPGFKDALVLIPTEKLIYKPEF